MVARAETTTPSHGRSLDLDAWLNVVGQGRSDAEQSIIRMALTRAQAAHKDQTRASGEPYLLHCLAVAEIVHHLKLDHEAVAAAILHDAVEDTDVTLQEVAQTFGAQVARLVDGVTKMGRIGEMRGGATARPPCVRVNVQLRDAARRGR